MTSGCRQLYPVILGAHINVWSCTCHISSHLKAGCAIHSPPPQEWGRKQWECIQGFQQVLKGKEENKASNTVTSLIDFRALNQFALKNQEQKIWVMSIMQKKTECRSTEGILDNCKDVLYSHFRGFKSFHQSKWTALPDMWCFQILHCSSVHPSHLSWQCGCLRSLLHPMESC